MHFTLPLLLIQALGASAVLKLDTKEALDRYVPGSFLTIQRTMETDDHGFMDVCDGGVLRSFSNDNTVIDYHQLDPDQVKEFAELQLKSWNAMGKEVPESIEKLAQAPYPDGRKILDKTTLLNPVRENGNQLISRSAANAIIEELHGKNKRQECVGSECLYLNQCLKFRPTSCYQCYFNNKAPVGACMLA